MEKGALNKCLTLTHTKLSIDLDFEHQRFRGSVVFNLSASLSELSKLNILADLYLLVNCRDQIEIYSAYINDSPCEFTHKDMLSHILVDDEHGHFPHKIYHHDMLRRKYTNSFLSPELNIDISSQLTSLIKQSNSKMTEVDDTDEISFTMTIIFKSNDSIPLQKRCGFFFTDSGFFYTSNARSWFPCLDSNIFNPNNRCSWDIEVICPIENRASESDTIVVSCGELLQQVVHPDNSSLKICTFYLAHQTNAQSLSIVAGPLNMQALTGLNSSCRAWVFYPPGYEACLDHSISFLSKVVDYFSTYIGASFPFPSFKLVFLPGSLYSPIQSFCTLSILSTRYLVDSSIIEETFESRIEIARSIAYQWFGQYIFSKTWSDNWLIIGLAHYITGLFVRKHFGNNEYRFRLKKDMEKCFQLDFDQPPLYLANPSDIVILDDVSNENLVKLKSPIVLYMLEKFLGKNMMQKILNKTIVSAISGEMPGGLSTNHFLKSVKKISGKEPKPFADQWIFKPGTPKITASYFLNRKKNIIELKTVQETSRPLYIGNLTVRVHEPDGTFDHVVAIEEAVHNFELLYHTKYKRQRQNKKTMMLALKLELERSERERVEGLLPPPGTEDDEFMNMNDPEVAMEIAKADWKEVDDEGNEINIPISWIRLDPELDLSCSIEFKQSDYMDAQQLARDKDTVAQYDAVKRMSEHTNLRVAATLFRCLMDVRTFYRIRMQAAISLAVGFTKPETGAVGLYYLFLAFRKKFCIKNALTSDHQLVPRRNDFKAITEYFVQKSIPEALSMIRDVHGRCPLTVMKFLLSLMKLNDNTGNQYSDHGYVACLIDAIGHSFLPHKLSVMIPPANEEDSKVRSSILDNCVKEIEGLLFLETQVPSFRNTIALSCLRILLEFHLEKLTTINLKPFLLFSRYPNYEHVRFIAIDGLCLLGLHSIEVLQHLLLIMRSDPSNVIREYTARRLTIVSMFLNDFRKSLQEKEKPDTREMSLDVEDLSIGLAQTLSTKKKTLFEELEEKRKNTLLDIKFMDSLYQIFTQDLIYDDRSRRAVLSLCESLYDTTEFEANIPVPEMPKLKLLIKTEKEVEPNVLVDVEGSGDVVVQPAPPHVQTIQPVVEPVAKKIKLSLTLGKPKPVFPIPELKEKPDIEAKQTVVEEEIKKANEQKDTELEIKIADDLKSIDKAPETGIVPHVEEATKLLITPKIKLFLKPVKPVIKEELSPPAFNFEKAYHVLGTLMNQPLSYFFNQPVDPIRDGVPNYFEIITSPMDFGTISQKLQDGHYKINSEFEYDLELVLSNCFKFNKPKMIVYKAGKELEKIWKKEWYGNKNKRQKIK